MIVRRYVATFLPLRLKWTFFGDVIVEKVKVTKYTQHVGNQHVLISYSM